MIPKLFGMLYFIYSNWYVTMTIWITNNPLSQKIDTKNLIGLMWYDFIKFIWDGLIYIFDMVWPDL